jgi:UPF0716 protein FxsA
MFRILLVLFILVPIVEIAVFIQVGEQIGLSWTLLVVILTAVVGVNLLKQQGFKAWQQIQQSLAQGQMPALEMAAAAQLLFAGGLLLTPGFVTDIIGFLLMIPQVRMQLAQRLITQGVFKAKQSHNFYHSQASHQSFTDPESSFENDSAKNNGGRVIEGEYQDEDKSK